MTTLPVKKEQIDNFEFTVTALSASEGFPILMKLSQMTGKGNMADAIASLSQNDLNNIVETFAKNTLVKANGNTVPLLETSNIIFAGKYALMMKWLIMCAELNFGSFFLELPGLGDYINRKAEALVPKS